MKKRILFCNEASFMNSGYANYGRELLKRLYATGKYEIAEFGSYATVEDNRGKKLPWKFYPNAVLKNDSRYDQYIANPINSFGFWRFDLVCLDFKPNIVIDIRDPWMFEYQSFSPLKEFFHWILMPPVDSVPQKIEWMNTFNLADRLIPYTNWAKTALSIFDKHNLWPTTAPAGIDDQIFKPIKNVKAKYNIPSDTFVVGAVMRNQRRKLIPSIMEVFSSVINKTNKKCLLYLHTTYPELAGWDIPDFLIRHNIIDKVMFTYFCKQCKSYYPSLFRGAQTFCKKCDTYNCVLSGTGDGISDKELAEIYNLFDVLLQYSICEGFGIPQIEAGACGVPVCSVDYTAMSEVVSNIGGYKIPVNQIFCELESQAYRAYPDDNATIDTILKLANIYNTDEYKTIQNTTRNKTIEHYNWDSTLKTWIDAIDSIDINKKRSWHDKQKFSIPQSIEIDYSLSPFELAKNICETIIHSKELLYSEFCQKSIRDADFGITRTDKGFKPYTKEMLVKKLESYANNKVFIDDARLYSKAIVGDFIDYARG